MRKLGLFAAMIGIMTGCKTTGQNAQVKSADLAATATTGSDPNTICLNAQAFVGGVDASGLASVTQFTPYTNIKDFLASKPTIDSNLHLTTYVPDPVQARSQYPQIWCKLKNAHDLQAAAGTLSLHITGGGQNCDAYQKQLLTNALANDPNLAAVYKNLNYTFNYNNNTQLAGDTFVLAPAQIILNGGGAMTLRTVSLESASGLPTYGGMNYCKLVDPAGLPELFGDIAAGNFDYVALGANVSPKELGGSDLTIGSVSYNGILGDFLAQQANLFYQAGATFKGTYIISPGGGVPPLNMRSLAKAMARRGYIVFIVQYPLNLAILEKVALRNNAAVNLGAILKAHKVTSLQGLPGELTSYYQNNTTPVYVLGHSLGSAILGDAIFGDGPQPFDAIVVNAALSFITLDSQTQINPPVFFDILGLNDFLDITGPSAISNFQHATGMNQQIGTNLYQQSGAQHFFLEIPGMSHFCVLADLNVDPETLLLTAQDGPAQTPKTCEPLLLQALTNQGLL